MANFVIFGATGFAGRHITAELLDRGHAVDARALEYLGASDAAADCHYVSPSWEFGSWVPGTRTGSYWLGTDVPLKDDSGRSRISGADLAIAFADEIETPKHHRTRFTVGY